MFHDSTAKVSTPRVIKKRARKTETAIASSAARISPTTKPTAKRIAKAKEEIPGVAHTSSPEVQQAAADALVVNVQDNLYGEDFLAEVACLLNTPDCSASSQALVATPRLPFSSLLPPLE
eukprot:TRINITY_DN1692_c0_g1_i2.p3 TRINITY_DN1692_c0_g1~~TRINITY_DN1692_c0_g1_i2.p3  ORF type:complete len:120 (+),score=17.05 TRINITY_DN1692_c0_g1_i2:479-838(+)